MDAPLPSLPGPAPLPALLCAGRYPPLFVAPTVSDSFRAAWDPAVFEQVGSTDRAALVTDNQDALDVRLRMIGEAEVRIILSSFDIRDCDSGRDIFAALLLAADRGVQIQILWDGVSDCASLVTYTPTCGAR